MDNNTQGSGLVSIVIVSLTWLFNTIAMATKDDVAFGMSILVSIAALIHYIISIHKNTKRGNR